MVRRELSDTSLYQLEFSFLWGSRPEPAALRGHTECEEGTDCAPGGKAGTAWLCTRRVLELPPPSLRAVLMAASSISISLMTSCAEHAFPQLRRGSPGRTRSLFGSFVSPSLQGWFFSPSSSEESCSNRTGPQQAGRVILQFSLQRAVCLFILSAAFLIQYKFYILIRSNFQLLI